MKDTVEILFEQNGANDLVATVVMIAKESGQCVRKGDHLFDVETSKAVQAIDAPTDGILLHALSPGQSIQAGSRVGTISVDSAGLISDASSVASEVAESREDPRASVFNSRLSRNAVRLATELGLCEKDFSSPFVTRADVLRHAGQDRGAGRTVAEAKPPATGTLKPLPAHKQTEFRLLHQGAGNTMLSVVGSNIQLSEISRTGVGFFENRIADVVAHEASKLMASYPKLNAAVLDSGVRYYDYVNVGVAFDGASRLVVYGIENSNTLTLAQIQAEILKGFKKYVRNEFDPSELTRATFTVTDLSMTGIDFMFPLLPASQSSIVGIASAPTGGYRLFVGFDHRVTEGLEVSQFLQKLCLNVTNALSGFAFKKTIQCSYCGVPARNENSSPSSSLISLVNSEGRELLCCKDCWRR